jgi:NAD+ kinase
MALHPSKAMKYGKIQNIGIVYRTDSTLAKRSAVELTSWLKNRKLNVLSHPKQTIAGAKKLSAPTIKKLNLVIVLGGDGTYLEAVRMLDGERAPILGVNMGSLGFLTQNRKEDLYSAVSQTLEHKMEMRPRTLLDVKVQRNGKTIFEATALNDAVIERGSLSQLINLAIRSTHYSVGEVKADGLVIATPTGSTAYNLAAGGPILYPYVNAFVVTPICPHSLTHRPIIFPDDHVLNFRLLNKKHRAYLTIDGQSGTDLKPEDEVIIARAPCDHYVLRKPSQNYFDLLREKLNFGERAST